MLYTSCLCRVKARNSPANIHIHMSAYISIRQHTSAYVSIRQHANVSIRQHTSAYIFPSFLCRTKARNSPANTSAYVSIRQQYVTHTSARRQHTHMSAHSYAARKRGTHHRACPQASAPCHPYVSIRQHTSAYVSIRQQCSPQSMSASIGAKSSIAGCRMAVKRARYGSSAWFARGTYIVAGVHIC
jgi:hypothetical protein